MRSEYIDKWKSDIIAHADSDITDDYSEICKTVKGIMNNNTIDEKPYLILIQYQP
jgi:hypothetical protein